MPNVQVWLDHVLASVYTVHVASLGLNEVSTTLTVQLQT